MKKEWWKSKTIWTAIFAGITGIVSAFGVVIPDLVYQLAIAFGIYAVRDAIG